MNHQLYCSTHHYDSKTPEIARLIILSSLVHGSLQHFRGSILKGEAWSVQSAVLRLKARKTQIHDFDLSVIRVILIEQILL